MGEPLPPNTVSDSASLVDALGSSVGPGHVRRGRERDAVDDMIPRVVVTPGGTRDVETVVRECSARGLSLLPQGGATKIAFGNRPERHDIKLTMSGMTRISSRNPDDLTVTADAGISLSQLNRVLAVDGQRVALDANAAHRATLGGLAATDHRGSLAFRYGSPRDQILGMTVIDGRGRRLDLGGRVVKNVAGYDLTRLFIGSFGSLGAITEITIRTYPLADVTAELVFRFDDGETADRARKKVFASELPLAAFDARADVSTDSETSAWRLRCLLEGNAAEVEIQRERLVELCGSRPEPSTADASDAPSSNAARCVSTDDERVAVRIAAPPAVAIAVVEKIRRQLAPRFAPARIDGLLGHALFRVASAAAEPTDALAFVRTIERTCSEFAGAKAVTELAPAVLKSTLDVWGGVPPGLHLMKRIKQKFDPEGIFSPGRFVGRL